MLSQFNKYYWHDTNIEKIEISSNQITVLINNDYYENSITILCNEVVGLTDLCMWEDTIIDDAKLEYVDNELPSFLQEVMNSHPLDGEFYNNQPIRSNLLCLSMKLTNDIAFNIYCYEVKIHK